MTRFFIVIKKDAATTSLEVNSYEEALTVAANAFREGSKAFVFSGPDLETVLTAYPDLVRRGG